MLFLQFCILWWLWFKGKKKKKKALLGNFEDCAHSEVWVPTLELNLGVGGNGRWELPAAPLCSQGSEQWDALQNSVPFCAIHTFFFSSSIQSHGMLNQRELYDRRSPKDTKLQQKVPPGANFALTWKDVVRIHFTWRNIFSGFSGSVFLLLQDEHFCSRNAQSWRFLVLVFLYFFPCMAIPINVAHVCVPNTCPEDIRCSWVSKASAHGLVGDGLDWKGTYQTLPEENTELLCVLLWSNQWEIPPALRELL